MAKRRDKTKPGGMPLKNPKHELFAWLYAGTHNRELFGNGTRCYMQAYGYNERTKKIRDEIDEVISKREKGYTTKVDQLERRIKAIERTANTEASGILSKPYIRARVDFLMDTLLENNFMDRELVFAAGQRFDLASKVAAIREYNRMKDRSSEKLDATIEYRWADPEPAKK